MMAIATLLEDLLPMFTLFNPNFCILRSQSTRLGWVQALNSPLQASLLRRHSGASNTFAGLG